jgi:hypothetical protein
VQANRSAAGGRGGGALAGRAATTATAPKAAADRASTESAALTFRAGGALPMIARRASLLLVTPRFDDVRAAIERVAAAHGADLASYAVTTGAENQRRIVLTLRLAPEGLDGAMDALRLMGRVREEAVAADDLGNAHVDLTSRLTSVRTQETRLRDVLSGGAAVADALAVERELAQVRAEIVRLEGDLRPLEDRVARATITLQFDEGDRGTPIVRRSPDSPGSDDLGRARIWPDRLR